MGRKKNPKPPDGHSRLPRTQSGPSAPRVSRWRVAAVCLLLVLAVFAVFGRTARHDFFNFDDDQYVYKNHNLDQGLTPGGIGWALSARYSANWHPLTWISHLIDCELFGRKAAGGHHLHSVLLHALAAVALFLALLRMCGGKGDSPIFAGAKIGTVPGAKIGTVPALWPCAFVAALFAIHPLRVESVAWVAERKDVLSGLLFAATLWAYAGYAARPSWLRYVAVAVVYALGLTAKPMLVTVPFLLLLLDYWPLGRFSPGQPQMSGKHTPLGRLVVEKIPLLILAAGSCVMTVTAQSQVEAIKELSWLWRVVNALVTYAVYVVQMFYPANLAPFYPHPVSHYAAWEVVGAALLLAAVTGLAVWQARRRPWLLVGWLWYVGMLVPVIGLVQVGTQARADRYTYLPQIGLYVMAAWTVAAWCVRRPAAARLAAAAAAAAVVVLALLAWRQTGFWHDSVTLWNHTIECVPSNALMHHNLAAALGDRKDFDAAIDHGRQAVRIDPRHANAWRNLGVNLFMKKQYGEALECCQRAVEIDDHFADGENSLGAVLCTLGRREEGVRHFRKALQIEPGHADALDNLRKLQQEPTHDTMR
jgi:protein O-mannosyl-transferase